MQKIHITAKKNLFDLNFKELWEYRDLILMFVKRDFAATYKQTILGPLWFLIQPLLIAITFTFVFGRVTEISTSGIPKVIFYLSGIIIWTFFSECFTKTATVFKDNYALFGKVYFPRLIVPLSICISSLIRFSIHFFLFICYVCYYKVKHEINPNEFILLTPVLLILMAGLGLGAGILISSLTIRYRDLSYLISFGIQLLMFATPVFYMVNNINQEYRDVIMLNPLSSIIETFRFAYLGVGNYSFASLSYSLFFMMSILILGTFVFVKVENSFIDYI
jgi:lipopolysaccharide transport system permease protein